MSFHWKRYTGLEHLAYNKDELPLTVLDFWQFALSAIELNMSRGSLAEFVVQSAMRSGGFFFDDGVKTGIEPYDLTGPVIESIGRNARIEVKSSAFRQPTSDKVYDNAQFSIARHRPPDGHGWFEESEAHNNDLYVFCLFTDTSDNYNVLDLANWDFYVYPTHLIDSHKSLSKLKTMSLKRLNLLSVQKQSYFTLYDEILRVINEISEYYEKQSG